LNYNVFLTKIATLQFDILTNDIVLKKKILHALHNRCDEHMTN